MCFCVRIFLCVFVFSESSDHRHAVPTLSYSGKASLVYYMVLSAVR